MDAVTSVKRFDEKSNWGYFNKTGKNNLIFGNVNNLLEMYTTVVEIHIKSKCRIQKGPSS